MTYFIKRKQKNTDKIFKKVSYKTGNIKNCTMFYKKINAGLTFLHLLKLFV